MVSSVHKLAIACDECLTWVGDRIARLRYKRKPICALVVNERASESSSCSTRSIEHLIEQEEKPRNNGQL